MTPPTAPSEFTKVHRLPGRAAYDTEAVHAVLDAALVGHVGLVRQGRPVVIPMLFGRLDEHVYLHGSVAAGVLRDGADGAEVCLTATVVDGLVFARSAFHHSMNYRSAVVVGPVATVQGEEKVAGLRAIAEHLTPGRWAEVRPPTEAELRQTMVLRLSLAEASTKCRTGGPVDDAEDLALDVWAGVVPTAVGYARPDDAEDLPAGIAVSPAVAALRRQA